MAYEQRAKRGESRDMVATSAFQGLTGEEAMRLWLDGFGLAVGPARSSSASPGNSLHRFLVHDCDDVGFELLELTLTQDV
jgi:hypothetical protein